MSDMKFEGTDVRFGTDMKVHIRNLKDAVKAFLYDAKENPADFAELSAFMDERFNVVDNEMFREWIDKEFPGKFAFQ
jgi:hypothetical protein